MVLPEVHSQSLEWLLQNLLRYEHHVEELQVGFRSADNTVWITDK